MNIKSLALLFSGALLGAGLLALILGIRPAAETDDRFTNPPATRALVVEETRTATESDELRRDGFSKINTVVDALSLHGDFNKKEALYSLAGRSDSVQIQNLIYEANDLADGSQRILAVSILLERLVDLDPPSAIAIAGSPALAGLVERDVWAAWYRARPEEALGAAAGLPAQRRGRAAQGIYRGLEPPELESVNEIRDALGTSPNAMTMLAFLESMYASSPSDATGFIEGMPPTSAEQTMALSLLVYLVAQSGVEGSVQFARPRLQRQFDTILDATLYQFQPETAVQRYLDSPSGHRYRFFAAEAMRAIAATDAERAILLLDGFDEETRAMAVGNIAEGIMVQDPEAALAWIREFDKSEDRSAYRGFLATLAVSDLELALSEVELITDRSQRDFTLSGISMQVVQDDVEIAQSVIERIGDTEQRARALQNAIQSLAVLDTDAALAWHAMLSEADRQAVTPGIVRYIVGVDPDKAVVLLDGLDEESVEGVSGSIASAMAMGRGFDSALEFVERYRGAAGYRFLKAAMLKNLAARHPERALEMAARDLADEQMVGVLSEAVRPLVSTNPDLAASYAMQVSTASERQRAMGYVASRWLNTDAVSATEWILRQPKGKERDELLEIAIGVRRDAGPTETLRLVRAITPANRVDVATPIVNRMGQWAFEDAAAMMDELNLTPDTRLSLENWMRQQQQ